MDFVIGNIEMTSVKAHPFLLLFFSSYPRQTDHNESVILLMNNVIADATALPASYKSLIYIWNRTKCMAILYFCLCQS
jgi:hypothetical protein